MKDDAVWQVADEKFGERVFLTQPLRVAETKMVSKRVADMMAVVDGRADDRRGATMGCPPICRVRSDGEVLYGGHAVLLVGVRRRAAAKGAKAALSINE